MTQSKEQIFKLGNSEFDFSNTNIVDLISPLDWDVKIKDVSEYHHLLSEARTMILSYEEMENIPSVELAKILKLLQWMERLFSTPYSTALDS